MFSGYQRANMAVTDGPDANGQSSKSTTSSPRPRFAAPEEIQVDTEEEEDPRSSDEAARVPRQVPTRPRQPSGPQPPLSRTEQKIAATIRQHYYPEGGWGWVVCVCVCLVNFLTWGLQLNYGVLHGPVVRQFGEEHVMEAAWLGSLSLCSSFFISPVVVAWCRRKSTRLTAVLGGLVAALGCLFTSFASQFHQALFSYGLVLAVGLGMARDAAQLVLAQYFKRRRHCVEVAASAGAGLGVAAFACILHALLGSLGWRHGLQAATGLVSLAFLLGVFYRSASLYHPQRRAIVHLKNQKRKIKEKHPTTEKPPFFDFAALRTRTLRVVMTSAALAAAGVYTPFFYLVPLSTDEGVEGAWVLQALLGLAFAAGSGLAGLLQLQQPSQCLVGRRCLCQLSLLAAGLSLLSLQALQGFTGYVLFARAYGISAGSLAYALKMLVFERLRARHFNRAWGFVQWVQFLPVLVGVPVTSEYSSMHQLNSLM